MPERFVDRYLLYLLARASSEVSNQFHRRLKNHNLQVPEWRVLASLSDGDGMTVGELADRALQHQPTMTKIIDRMESSGLVQRRQGKPDRRTVGVFITTEGRRRVDAALKDAKVHEAEVLANYSAEETVRLKEMLKILISRNETQPNRD